MNETYAKLKGFAQERLQDSYNNDGHCNAEFCCDNENSEYYAVPTFYNDTCEEWEKK